MRPVGKQQMTMMMTAALLSAALVAGQSAPALDAVVKTRLDSDLQCHLGAYALPGGRYLTIAGSQGHPRDLSYGRSEGGLGRLAAQADGTYAAPAQGGPRLAFESCASGRMRMEDGGATVTGRRLPLVVRETRFQSGEVSLRGKLVLPPGGKAKALAVWIGGSNNDPDTDDVAWQYELARRGVGVFVYDKRGTGGSTGDLTANFDLRAADTVAAIAEARRLAPAIRKVGVIGASQGGWVAPLTATLTPLDFVVPAFALAEGVPGQDKAVVAEQLRRAGQSEDAQRKAAELTAAAEVVVRSNFTTGYEVLEALKAKYQGETWYAAIQPRSYTGVLMRITPEQARAGGPALSQGLSFNYEPRPVIETIKPRQLWLLGGSDRQAPSARTVQILQEIQHTRRDLDVVVFPAADHGLTERFKGAGGETSAYSAGLFDLLASWILTGRATAPDTTATVFPGRKS